MKVVKTLKKQLELAAQKNLFIPCNGRYLLVGINQVFDMQGTTFYTNEKAEKIVIDAQELKRLYKKVAGVKR